MPKCIYCGEKAGLLSKEHKECRHLADESVKNGKSLLREAIVIGAPSGEVIAALQETRTAGRLDPNSDVAIEWLRAADGAALERSKLEPISVDAFEEIANLFVYLRPDFLHQGDGLLNFPGYISLDHSSTIHQVLHNQVPYMSKEAYSGFVLGRDENLILKRYAQLAEYGHTVQSGIHQSLSLPVGGGIYYRLGASTPRVAQTALRVVDQGKMALTDRAIYFGGDLYTLRIAYEDILRLEPYSDAFEVHEYHGTGKVFVPGTLGFDDGWYFYALISAFIDRVRN